MIFFKHLDIRGFLHRVVQSDLAKKSGFTIGEIKVGCDEYSWCSYYKNYCSHPTVKTFCKGTCGICRKYFIHIISCILILSPRSEYNLLTLRR